MKVKTLDYSKDENWAVKQSNGDKLVDSIFFTPINDGGCEEMICGVNDDIRQKVILSYKRAAYSFEKFANGYVPLFHQATTKALLSCKSGKEFTDFLYKEEIRNDIYAALDYYFEHYNNNKPFILSGICQGVGILLYVLSEYMKLHPDYYKRMVVCYAIGGSIGQTYLKNNPHVKPALNELDTGVIVSFNTIPDNHKPFINMMVYDKPCIINPLNWKTDGTYADASLNKGLLEYKTLKIKKGLVDAYIDTTNHVLLSKTAQTKANIKPCYLYDRFCNSFHLCEWDLFYENIKINAHKRVKAYLKKK